MAVNDITQTISSIPQAGKRGVDVQTIFVNKQESFQDALTDVFVGQINTLRTQLNTFVGQVNTTATQVNTDATSASTSATTATTKASEASTSASQALTSRNQAETFAQQAQASATSIDVNKIVHRTGDESIAGVKTFTSSPIVPTPTMNTQVVNKEYVDDTKISKPELISIIGSATFNGTTQNINLTNIGNITLAIGDVIEVSGTTGNDKLFTVESIVDNDNIVVNYEHRGTSIPVPDKRLANETSSNCTIKLYNRAKNAPIGQGQDYCNLVNNRALNVTYTNSTNRTIILALSFSTNSGVNDYDILVNGITPYSFYVSLLDPTGEGDGRRPVTVLIPPKATFAINSSSGNKPNWFELR